LGPAAGFAPAAGPALTTAGTWQLDALTPSAARAVTTDVRDAMPRARVVLGLVDGSIAIDRNAGICGPTVDSCSGPAPAGAARPWRLHLSADTTSDTLPAYRFYVLHEIGHAVWGLLFRDRDRIAFARAVHGSLHGKPCRRVRDGRPCAPITELFADEFARWAGGFHANMTGYQTPPLLATTDMSRLIADAVAAATS
jgi:hypothetical protein